MSSVHDRSVARVLYVLALSFGSAIAKEEASSTSMDIIPLSAASYGVEKRERSMGQSTLPADESRE